MPVQTIVDKAARFAAFNAMLESVVEFGLDSEKFLDWLEAKLNQYVEEEMGRGRKAVAKIDLSGDFLSLLTRWHTVQAQMKTLQDEEAQLRTKIVFDGFTKEQLEGTETRDIGDGSGYRLKATKVMNYSATNASGQVMNLLNVVGPIDQALAQNLISWKPDISTPAYRDLVKLLEIHPELKGLAAACITVKPGMPQLEIVAPKSTEGTDQV